MWPPAGAHLRRTAFLLCGDWHAAEDLVQVALAKLYVAWPRVRRDGEPEAYARRILCAPTSTRRVGRGAENAPVRRCPRSQPAESLPVEDREALLAALASLPAGQRGAVVLRHWVGLQRRGDRRGHGLFHRHRQESDRTCCHPPARCARRARADSGGQP